MLDSNLLSGANKSWKQQLKNPQFANKAFLQHQPLKIQPMSNHRDVIRKWYEICQLFVSWKDTDIPKWHIHRHAKIDDRHEHHTNSDELHCPSCCKTSTNNTNAAVLQGHITLYVFEGNWPHNKASWFQQFSHDEGWEVVFLACHLAHPSQACPQKYQENSKLMKFSTNGNWMSYQLIVACFIDNPICILWTVLFIK